LEQINANAWSQFAAAAPEMEAFGRSRLEDKIAYLATSRADGGPRVHPVSPFIAEGSLFIYMEPTSPKRHDLRRDPRYALHCSVEDNSGGQGEFCIKGRAEEVNDPARRAMAFKQAKSRGYDPKERYVLFELKIEESQSTTYTDDGPVRSKWKAS